MKSSELIEAQKRLLQRRREVRITTQVRTPTPRTPEAQEGPQELVAGLVRLGVEASNHTKAWREWAAGRAKSKACANHPAITRAVDVEESVRRSYAEKEFLMVFKACPVCAALMSSPRSWLIKSGAPLEFADATLKNWQPRTEADKAALSKVCGFVKKRNGFLILLGETGLGKTHLAVGVMQEWRVGMFIKHEPLLSKIRDDYHTGESQTVDRAMMAKLLVLDEIGLSTGGRDELPKLHTILSYRHENYLPTILTGNVPYNQLSSVLGERMVSRFDQSCYACITLTGTSWRKEMRNQYGKARQ